MCERLMIVPRHHLKVIVESNAEVLSVTLCRTLVDLALVRPDGDSFSATKDGALRCKFILTR